MNTSTALRALALTSRIVSPVVTTAALVGLGLYAWRTWLRVRAETQWETDWVEFRRRQRDRDT
ncbi:MAG TPA: hypothetical protein VL403_07830 [Candidatus Kryptonia bacterium]|nr:hypothetical protein [Candidatus Kryptonia bacterium]